MSKNIGDKVVVVLSGGQDSTTCLFWAKQNFNEVHAITFDYGQRHSIEIEAAIKVAEIAGVASHQIKNVRGLLESTSPLTSDTELEQYTDFDSMNEIIGDRVEKTFVPMRNTFFLTLAMNRALAVGARTIVTGVCQEDNANYPDCTDNFVLALQDAFTESLATEVTILAPLLYYSKADTVRLAATLPGCFDALAYSHTSYDGKYPPTDMNHANILRAHGFVEAGVPDPLVVRAWKEGLMDLPDTENYDALVEEAPRNDY